MQVMAGLLGIPPSNCVIPQAPMHTKSLITLKQMLVERNEKRKSRIDLSALDAKTKSQLNLTALAGEPVAEAAKRDGTDAKPGVNSPIAEAAEQDGTDGDASAGGPVAEAAGGAGSPLSTSSGRSSVDVLAKHGIEKVRCPGLKQRTLSHRITSFTSDLRHDACVPEQRSGALIAGWGQVDQAVATAAW